MLRRVLLVCPILGLVAAARAAEALPEPLQDYMDAAARVKEGRMAEAVYPFYRGQLRARIHMLAHPEQPPDGEPALVGSLNQVLGTPINEWAFGDLPALLNTLDRVIAWHAANDDPWTPKARFPEAHAKVLAGLVEMRGYVATHGSEIRAKRQENGLPNRR